MNSDSMWELFYKTGNVIFYLLHKELVKVEDEDKTA